MVNLLKVADLGRKITNRCNLGNKNTIIPRYFAGFGDSRYVIKVIKYTYTELEMKKRVVKITLDDDFNEEDNGKIVEDLFDLLDKEEK